ncbi:glycosyltransferase [Marine Group I thaumarchaeote]|uniref:Glycosyltransferase n=1 Tax=Marine Group I thaumarchaeote TaxID=2511932 RepID=A0A7K4NLK9_9ARCH|nr:glycosyltransferase [Marine Group I thaumarchaeote]
MEFVSPNPFTSFVFYIFIACAIIIIAYTCNFYYLAFLSGRRKENQNTVSIGEPTVTIHLPIYNEKYVTKRLINSVCDLDYPKEKLCIMVLDDSDDNTTEQIAELVENYKGKGFDISHVRRGTRQGYKAGALKYAMKYTKSEFVAIFDADFIPPKWYLKKAIPYFSKPNIGFVQCRWGHINENYSALTQAQALSLDFHFLVEQRAKSNSHLFMNFNGTAGIWRKECIEDSGGWHTATLVEDLDLSYRAQMKGWKCLFIPDIVVNAELPVQMNGAKRQQFRWAKGSIQCAIKLLGGILVKRKIAIDAKLQAFVQLTRHIVFPLMLIQFLALPILLASNVNLYIVSFLPVVTLATYVAMGPGAYLFIIRNMYDKNRKEKAIAMPYLIIYSMGMAVNNTIAVIDAMVGKKSEFLRTPKYGIVKNTDDWRTKAYNLPFSKTTLLELFFGIYGIMAILIAIYSRNPIWVPIIALQTMGFLYIACMSFSHTRFKRGNSKIDNTKTKDENMADIIHKLAVAGIVAIICFGAYLAYTGYQNDVYPMDLSIGLFDRIMASSEPQTIMTDINAIKEYLPAVGNPVWIFPTDTTNFTRIQADLSVMLASAEKISVVPRDSSAFHTGMMDVSDRAKIIQKQIMDIVPYMYASVSNILFASIWIAVIIGIFAILKRKKQSLEAFDKSEGV